MTAKKERKQQRRAKKRKAQRVSQPSGQHILLRRAQQSDALKNAQIVVWSTQGIPKRCPMSSCGLLNPSSTVPMAASRKM